MILPPPTGCPKSPQFRARSAFCATLEGVEAPEGAFFGQAPQQIFSCTPGSVEDEVLTIIQQRF